MKINGFNVMDDQTKSLGPDFDEFWWAEIHSGSEAMQYAREFLNNPRMFYSDISAVDVMLICSELIFRVTGEKVMPNTKRMYWEGKTLHSGGLEWEIDFSG